MDDTVGRGKAKASLAYMKHRGHRMESVGSSALVGVGLCLGPDAPACGTQRGGPLGPRQGLRLLHGAQESCMDGVGFSAFGHSIVLE